jgi:hypothetical protein
MRRFGLIAMGLALVGAVAFAALAFATAPKPNGYFVDAKKSFDLYTDSTGKHVTTFDLRCPPKASNFKFFATISSIKGFPINRKGAFHFDKSNLLNRPDGSTAGSARVTIDGKFVSRREATGTYQIHKGGCKQTSFDAKLSH